MSKNCEIAHCGQCPNFDNLGPTYFESCRKTGAIVDKDTTAIYDSYPIPDDCPLEDWNDAE
jgi:hypothetical protein